MAVASQLVPFASVMAREALQRYYFYNVADERVNFANGDNSAGALPFHRA